jgi:hypothetical protein
MRVVKSTLRKAELDVYSREAVNPPDTFSAGKTRAVMRVTAKSGGRWGSRKRAIWRETALIGDIAATAITTGLTMLADEWADGVVRLDGVPTKEYAIVSNNVSGVVTVSSDANMAADLAAGGTPTDKGYTLELETRVGAAGLQRTLAVELGDGEQNPSTEFSLNIYVNEEMARRYPNLSMDPASANYFVRIINDDGGNEEVEVTDLLSPSNPVPTDRRPANENGIVSAITATVLTSKLFQVRQTAGVSNPSFTLGTTTDNHKYRDIIEFEVTAAAGTATLSMKSMRVGGGSAVHAPVTAANTVGTAFTFGSPAAPHIPPITISRWLKSWP